MLRSFLTDQIRAAVSRLVSSGELPEAVRDIPVELSDTKNPDHGDFACNFALVATKAAGVPPRQIAEKLRDALLSVTPQDRNTATPFDAIDVAGPGFLNLKLRPEFVAAYVHRILELGEDLPKSKAENPKSINVEFVSVNPNGPITVGSARGAAFGDALSQVLAAAGHKAYREYYVNDGVNSEQMRQFGESVRHYVRLKAGLPSNLPEKAYRGDYVMDVAGEIAEQLRFASRWEVEEWYKGNVAMADLIASDLEKLKPELGRAASAVEIEEQEELLGLYKRTLVVYSKALDSLDQAQVVGDDLVAEYGKTIAVMPVDWYQERAQKRMIERQRGDLALFGVRFDEWFSEQSLHNSGAVERAIKKLTANGAADADPYRMETPKDDPERNLVKVEQEPGAVWLRSTRFGDDQDRVLIREDGRPAYIAADVAYLESKLGDRNFDRAIMVLGPDHHGYIARMQAVAQALGYEAERLEIIIFQIVRFVKEGKPAPMRKRDGNIYELRDLINELGAAVAPQADREEQHRIGVDVARFFYLMRSHETHMDFDIDLATKQSDENPVFYAQYAYARICSVIRKAQEAGFQASGDADVSLLVHPKESALVKKILDLPWEVRRIAEDYGVHRLTTYAVELARTYHLFYDVCRVIQPEEAELTRARLALCEAARVGLKSTFDLLGISAPERMEREALEHATA